MSATETVDPGLVSLVNRAKAGDGAAFAELYDRYVDQTFGYIYRRVGHRQTCFYVLCDVCPALSGRV
jgi:DNA-directed RNA polymerase specialized sigma24 family protein